MKYLSIFLAVATAATAVGIAVTVVTITTDTVYKVRAIRAGVKGCIAEIVTQAKLDNPIVGAKIEQIIAAYTKKAVGLLELSKALTTLSTEGATGLRSSFIQILAAAKADVTPHVYELSPEVRQNISYGFRRDLADWKRQCQEVYTTFGMDYNNLPTVESALGYGEGELLGNAVGKAVGQY